MAKILLLGTWLVDGPKTKDAIIAANDGSLTFSGLSGQLQISGPRITIPRTLVVNDRTWKHGMPRSVAEGDIETHDDQIFIVIDEKQTGRRGGG